MTNQGIAQYQRVSTQTSVMDADPHRLIQLLFNGALAKMAVARGAIERKNFEEKNRALNSAIDIVNGLRESLNLDAGDLAGNLDNLYEYMIFRLFEANAKNDVARIDEVHGLLSQIKEAWDAIREQAIATQPMQQVAR
ncbi:flagellar export chaperone FliS [Salinibius halmophilus]|uniref:flagellar export chaperone FliS n=1 Tax=Salinibius halmophilus TaxID=1853216 RepID=UPI000E65F3B8|nr:flagellar export chaperone FliS [Salinibius halmophilus]